MKYCSMCKLDKPRTEFNRNRTRKDGLQHRCKPCDRVRGLTQYYKDPIHSRKTIQAGKKRRREENYSKVYQILQQTSCKSCGTKDPRVLEFDHLDPSKKIANVSELICEGVKWDRVEEEIKKCQILCANCHKIKTAEQFGYYKSRVSIQG